MAIFWNISCDHNSIITLDIFLWFYLITNDLSFRHGIFPFSSEAMDVSVNGNRPILCRDIHWGKLWKLGFRLISPLFVHSIIIVFQAVFYSLAFILINLFKKRQTVGMLEVKQIFSLQTLQYTNMHKFKHIPVHRLDAQRAKRN